MLFIRQGALISVMEKDNIVNINCVILIAAIMFSSLGICAKNNDLVTAVPLKSMPFTTVFFAPRTQYRTASETFLQRLMLTGVVQDQRAY